MVFVDLEKRFDYKKSASEGHLVGAEKTWYEGVDCATGPGELYANTRSHSMLVRGTMKNLK